MIVIAGKNNIAVHGLELAIKKFGAMNVVAVPNKNDDGVDGWQRSFKKFASDQGVKVLGLDDIYDRNVDLFLSLEFDRIVKPERISTDRVYNVHFSLLPKYKGMYTSVWPILNGDSLSGVTLHEIDSGIDTGEVVAAKEFKVSSSDRSQDCYRKFIKNSKILLDQEFGNIIGEKKPCSKKQPWEGASYHPGSSLDFSNLTIDFNKTAWEVQRQVYAFSFRPYQLMPFNGKPVSSVIVRDQRSRKKPGAIIEMQHDRVVIATVDYDIELVFDAFESVLNDLKEMSIPVLEKSLSGTLGVNDKNDKGWSMLIVAAYFGRLDLMDALLRWGADINDVNNNGTSVLMYAKDHDIYHKTSETVKFVLERGGDPEIKDYSGKTVHEYVSSKQAGELGL